MSFLQKKKEVHEVYHKNKEKFKIYEFIEFVACIVERRLCANIMYKRVINNKLN